MDGQWEKTRNYYYDDLTNDRVSADCNRGSLKVHQFNLRSLSFPQYKKEEPPSLIEEFLASFLSPVRPPSLALVNKF